MGVVRLGRTGLGSLLGRGATRGFGPLSLLLLGVRLVRGLGLSLSLRSVVTTSVQFALIDAERDLLPSDEEVALNPRARSSRLRVAERL